jgi:hypothetical protein
MRIDGFLRLVLGVAVLLLGQGAEAHSATAHPL